MSSDIRTRLQHAIEDGWPSTDKMELLLVDAAATIARLNARIAELEGFLEAERATSAARAGQIKACRATIARLEGTIMRGGAALDEAHDRIAELENWIRYIADSPPPEVGGFSVEAKAAAKKILGVEAEGDAGCTP